MLSAPRSWRRSSGGAGCCTRSSPMPVSPVSRSSAEPGSMPRSPRSPRVRHMCSSWPSSIGSAGACSTSPPSWRVRREKWNLVALDLGVDLSTPAGEFLASVMASAAQWERKIIGQRTREGLAAKRAAGVVLGRPRSLTLDVVQRIVHERAAGRSLSAIATALNRERSPRRKEGGSGIPQPSALS